MKKNYITAIILILLVIFFFVFTILQYRKWNIMLDLYERAKAKNKINPIYLVFIFFVMLGSILCFSSTL